MLRRVYGVALSLLFVSAGHAEVYRWVDEAGKVHFGDRPPAIAGAATALPEAKAPRLSEEERQRQERRRRARQRLLEVYEEERRSAAAARERARHQEEKRAQECDRARRRLADYERAGGLYDELPDGSRRYLSGPERRAEMEKARQAVAHWCGAGG